MVQLDALEIGHGSRRLIYLHGFPDHPPTARRFLTALADRGHHVLAPYLPGYAPSPRIESYDPESIARHILELADQWSPDAPVDLVGHDWGSVVTQFACQLAPARVGRAVMLAVPHLRTFIAQMRRPAQLRASAYQAFFQLPGSSWLASRNDFAFIDRLWRTWSPGFALADDEHRALHDTLRASWPAPLEYYRDTRRRMRALLAVAKRPITTPVLALHGANDGCVLPTIADDRHRFSGPYEREIMPALGHFVHLEAPTELADRVSGWLASPARS